MTTTQTSEFRPIESAPQRRVWPWAVLGAALVVGLVFIARRGAPAAPEKAVVTANVAPAALPLPAADPAVKPASPNVIAGAVTAAKSIAMVARAELDRELQRTRTAQQQSAAYRKQIDELQKQLGEARSQLAAVQQARKPPPPSDQEQILQMLAPVLKTSSNDGHP